MADIRLIKLDGELTMRSVMQQLDLLLDQPLDGIDLSGVTRVDSAGLALLLELQARSVALGKTIPFQNPPANLEVLARLSQVESLLGWPPNQDK